MREFLKQMLAYRKMFVGFLVLSLVPFLKDEIKARVFDSFWEWIGGPKVLGDLGNWMSAHPLQSAGVAVIAYTAIAAIRSELHVRRNSAPANPLAILVEPNTVPPRHLTADELETLHHAAIAAPGKAVAEAYKRSPAPLPSSSDSEAQRIAKTRIAHGLQRAAEERKAIQAGITEVFTLKVDVVLKDNTGGTPGLHIQAVSRERTAIEGAVFIVTNILVWDGQGFVTSKDVHDSGIDFKEMQMGKNTLHPGEPEKMGFIRADTSRVEFNGGTASNPQAHIRLTKAGIRRVSYRIDDGNLRSVSGAFCFRWEGPDIKIPPTPWDCPTGGN